MTFAMLGFALMTAGLSLTFSLAILAEKPALAMVACGCCCVSGGWTLIQANWPFYRSKR